MVRIQGLKNVKDLKQNNTIKIDKDEATLCIDCKCVIDKKLTRCPACEEALNKTLEEVKEVNARKDALKRFCKQTIENTK